MANTIVASAPEEKNALILFFRKVPESNFGRGVTIHVLGSDL